MKNILVGSMVSALVLVGGAGRLSAQAAPDNLPLFETVTLAKSVGGAYKTNAYPVLARTATGRLLCIFAAANDDPAEKNPNAQKKLHIVRSASDDQGRTWGLFTTVFNTPGKVDADPNLLIDGDRILAFSTTIDEKMDHSDVWMSECRDNGATWSKPVLMKTPHKYVCGKIHVGHRLADGALVMGYSWDSAIERGIKFTTEGESVMRASVLRSTDGGKNWAPGADMYAQVDKVSTRAVFGLDEPSTVVLADGRMFALLRNGGTKFYESFSADGGSTWATPKPSSLTAHNSPAAMVRLDQSRDVLVVWDNSPEGRHPLAVALSQDDCRTWSAPRIVVDTDGPQVSYPSACQAADGTLMVAWQQDLPEKRGREIKIARFNRAWLLGKK